MVMYWRFEALKYTTKDLLIIQREIHNGCEKDLYVRKLKKEYILLYGCFIYKFNVYSAWIINGR